MKNKLLCYGYGKPVRVKVYTNPHDAETMEVAELPPLQRHLQDFGLAVTEEGNVVLTGGVDLDAMDPSADCFLHNLATGEWSELPKLDNRRSHHGTHTVG